MQHKPLNPGLSRREFLLNSLLCAGAIGTGAWLAGCGGEAGTRRPAGNGGNGYQVAPLRSTADENGLLLPEGFRSRVIAQAAMPVPNTGYLLPLPAFPDGAATYPDPEVPGGWILLLNREVPEVINLAGLGVSGGVTAIRFSPEGEISDAYSVLDGTSTNCAGGVTPWGTWISCEEVDAGTSYEVHPLGQGSFNGVTYPRRLDSLGIFKHEAAAIDPLRRQVYLTEDQGDGRFYRLVSDDPQPWDGSVPGDLTRGTLQVAEVLGSDPMHSRQVVWHDVPDPLGSSVPTREQVAASTAFAGGEGCFWHDGIVYFTTKGDNRLWAYDVAAARLDVIYDDDLFDTPILTGVDNVIVSPEGNILVAEDGGDMQAVVLTPSGQIAPLVQVAGQEGSEITGLALSPDGRRLYFNSQRGGDIVLPLAVLDLLPFLSSALPISGNVGGGIVYEISREDGLAIFA